MTLASLAARVWFAGGARWRAVRVLLIPFGAVFRRAVALRNSLYDRGLFSTAEPPIPCIAVGNLTVGGTGKTPLAAWLAAELGRRGARPAIVLRGYGGDETLVHRVLNPGAVVVAARDRLAGVREAASRGADVAVLDDAFQHRRVRREADLVLLSADAWAGTVRPLPAGPWREPLSALHRAAAVIVTCKAASPGDAERVVRAIRASGVRVPAIVVRLEAAELRRLDGGVSRPLASLRGLTAVVVAGIGDPKSFLTQLAPFAAVVRPVLFGDHHAYTAADADAIATQRGDIVICTLKDAVKLAPLWPRAREPFWYVSQRLDPGDGAALLAHVVDRALAARFPIRHSGRHPAPPA